MFAKISTPVHLTPPLKFPFWNFVTAIGLKKTRMMPLPYQIVKKCDDMSILLDIIPALD